MIVSIFTDFIMRFYCYDFNINSISEPFFYISKSLVVRYFRVLYL